MRASFNVKRLFSSILFATPTRFVVSYSYPGTGKRECKRKISTSGNGHSSTHICVGDSVWGKFLEIYLVAINSEVLTEHQIKRESVIRNGVDGHEQIRGPIEPRNFFAARKRGRDIPAIARVRVEIKM